MNIYVIYQPEALDARDMSEHILDYLSYRYGRSRVSGTGRPGDARAHQRALTRANAVIALIGPSWVSHVNQRTEFELTQAQALRKMIVPCLVGGAALPSPTTRGQAALMTRQVARIRPDPEMADDLNHLFGEINTQLGWAPMSGALLASAIFLLLISAPALLFDVLPLGVRNSEGRSAGVDIYVFAFFPLAILMLGVALWQTWRRRTLQWALALGLGVIVVVAEFASTARYALNLYRLSPGLWWASTLGILAPLVILLAFALFGPRRELQRLTPPRIYRPRPRAAAPQPR